VSRNKNRIGETGAPSNDTTPAFNPLNFVTPTEFVDLPSQGEGYPDDHPLHGNDTMEIRFMTAKDEDILTSQTLLKKGVAIERFIDNIIVDKNIKASDLLMGDRNAVLIAARISGYGSTYDAVVGCRECGTQNRLQFDLSNSSIKKSAVHADLNVSKNNNGTYNVVLPFTKFNVTLRLMTGEDETYISKHLAKVRKNQLPETLLTTQFKRIIVAVEGHSEREVVNTFVDNMTTTDSRHIRLVNKLITPDINITETLVCKECSSEQEVDVPFGTDFFWPDR
jgi:hypothetical protein